MAEQSIEIFDRDIFFDIVGGDMETGIMLIHEYIYQTETHLAFLEDQLKDTDRDAMGKTAHLIKGSSLNIAATKLSEASLVLEKGAATLNHTELANAVQDMKTAFYTLKEKLHAEFPK